jgi:hypothetical protein
MNLPGRMYWVGFNAVTVTAQQDLFAIVAHTNRVAFLVALRLWQTADVRDAEEEILSILFKQGATVAGSGGTVATPVPANVTDAVAGFTARVNDTTKANTGTIVDLDGLGWNVRMGELWLPPGEIIIPITGTRRCTVELASTPADSLVMSGRLGVFEVG